MRTVSLRKIYLLIIGIGIIALVQYLMYQRYNQWTIETTNIIQFEIISGLAVYIMFFSFLRENPINPTFLYSFFIFFLGYSFIPLNKYNELLGGYDFILLALTVFCFLSGSYLGGKLNIGLVPFPISHRYRLLVFHLVVFLSICIFLLECLRLGYIPLLRIASTNVYSETNENAIPILHYFTQAANIIPIWAYLLYKEGFISRRKRNLFILMSLFVILNSLSRQTWILSLMCLIFCYMFYKKVSKIKIIILSLVGGMLFILIGSVRLLTASVNTKSDTEYLQSYAGTQYDASLVETYIALYSTNNFTTFKNFVEESDAQDYRGYGVYTFRPIFTITLLNKLGFDIDSRFDSFAALGTYAIEPYLDFGLCGVIFLNIVYGFVFAFAYRKYEEKRYRWIIPWSLLAYCVIMAAFTNFFNTFFVWFMLIINFIVLPPLSNKENAR